MRPELIFDMEVYINYTLLLFKNRNMICHFELPLSRPEREMLGDIAARYRLITFNGVGYDIPLLMLVLRGDDSLKIKKASDRIIQQNLKWWHFEKEFHVKVNPPQLDHVDLMEVAPLTGSLKLYGGRLHSRSLQDLPVAPSKVVTEEDKVILRSYCENDCDTLNDLKIKLKVQSELREQMSKQYGIDLRSKSDAQIAEAVIKKEVEDILGRKLEKPAHSPGDRFHYQVPAWMQFGHLDILDRVREAWFVVSDAGKVMLPDELKKHKIQLGKGIYRMGIGGLHSSEKKQIVKRDAEHMLIDFDVASYYPAILLNQGLYPKHIGPEFLNVYRSIVRRRLEAKAAGQKAIAESLKITANGTFGKLSSKWSALYSPDLFIQIVITGQLALLMLIESFNDTPGIEVISANTDGVTVKCRRDCEQDALDVVKAWEKTTGYTMERADYEAMYSRDVNAYIAIQTDGKVKTKGPYGEGLPLHKNVSARICAQAVIDYLQFDASIEATIRGCTDVRQFIRMRSVKGGAKWQEKEIGRIARWYYSTEIEEAILYKCNNRLVAGSYGARPAMMLPTSVPEDLDYERYIDEAYLLLNMLGVLDQYVPTKKGVEETFAVAEEET